MNIDRIRALVVVLPLVATLGCTTTGVGSGATRGNEVQASFGWKSTDDRTGTLTAELSNGQHFSGSFFQITADTRVDQIRPLWAGYPGSWRGWRYWDAQPNEAFITHYSGRVVANLATPDGQHMRCHFQLIRPSRGMAGGGEGQCQLPSGTTIHATFPHG